MTRHYGTVEIARRLAFREIRSWRRPRAYAAISTDRLALVHQIEALVDLLELEDVGDHWVDLIFPFMYQSTIFGTSVRPHAPPNAAPFQTRPVEVGHAEAAAHSSLPSLTSKPMILSAPTILASCPRDWPRAP
jgi:hypothetical protein